MALMPFAGLSILDMGAGAGRIALPLAKVGACVTALDQSSTQCGYLRERARKARVEVRVVEDDLLTFCTEARFDIVILSFVLHLLDYDQQSLLIKKAKSVSTSRAVHVIGGFRKRDTWELVQQAYPHWALLHLAESEVHAMSGQSFPARCVVLGTNGFDAPPLAVDGPSLANLVLDQRRDASQLQLRKK